MGSMRDNGIILGPALLGLLLAGLVNQSLSVGLLGRDHSEMSDYDSTDALTTRSNHRDYNEDENDAEDQSIDDSIKVLSGPVRIPLAKLTPTSPRKPPNVEPVPYPSNPGKLDSGSERTSSGGFKGCGLAPLNKLTLDRSKMGKYISNGTIQKYGEWPFFVMIEIKNFNGYYICGGTLVSDRHIVTAAHCVINHNDWSLYPTNIITIIIGEHYRELHDTHEKKYRVSNICAYTRNREPLPIWDYALLTLSERVQFNDYVQPACLPKLNQQVNTFGPAATCYTIGGGLIRTNPDLLPAEIMKLRVENVPCDPWGFDLDDSRVCYTSAERYNGDACNGDSGSPVVCLDKDKRWVLMAAVSYGRSSCDTGDAGVYLRVRAAIPQIEHQCGVRLLQ